jgi:serine/threonine-protein kinase
MSFHDTPTMTLPDDAVAELTEDQSLLEGVGGATHIELGEALGKGGMGAVVRGEDTALDRPIAAKLLREEFRGNSRLVRRFLDEARLTASLEHPNIIPVHTLAWRADTGPFFTMKNAEGRTLLSHLRRVKDHLRGDTLDEIVGMLVRLCDALELAHAKGVAHCDLKAANIVLGRYGEVYLTDWGVARHFPAEPMLTADGRKAISGTPTMMAPEQARGDGVDGRTDVFGMGALLYLILSRRAPFRAESMHVAAMLAERGARPHIDVAAPSSPLTLRRIVERAMAHQAADRYPTIGHLREDLDRFRRGRLDAPVERVAKGTVLISEGDASDCMYIVKSGLFVVTREGTRDGETLQEVGAGAILGEVGLLAGGERTATVTAITDAEVQTVTARHFDEALQRIPPWLRAVIETTGSRFHEQG